MLKSNLFHIFDKLNLFSLENNKECVCVCVCVCMFKEIYVGLEV